MLKTESKFNSPLKQNHESKLSEPSDLKQPKAWSIPVTPKLPNNQIERRVSFAEQANNYPKTPQSMNKQQGQYTPLAKSNFNSKHDMSLQEAFEKHRHDLIDRSMQRQNIIQLRSQQRIQDSEFKREHYEALMTKRLEKEREYMKKTRLMNRTNFSSHSDGRNGNELPIRRRRMSVQEIYSQNKKMYEKLPEVKRKQENQRLEEARRLNRMKSSIYKKVCFILTNS